MEKNKLNKRTTNNKPPLKLDNFIWSEMEQLSIFYFTVEKTANGWLSGDISQMFVLPWL